MDGKDVQRRLAAIVAIDAVGYSRRMEQNESGTLAAIRQARREAFDPALAMFNGRLIKTTGDGLLAEFRSVRDAVRAAVAMQRRLLEFAAESEPLAFRIGINVGDIIVDGDDVFGDGVNIAARLESVCVPGGIVISRHAYDQMRDAPVDGFDDGGEIMVKNIARPLAILSLSPERILDLPVEVGVLSQDRGQRKWWRTYGLPLAALSICLAVAGFYGSRQRPAAPLLPPSFRADLASRIPKTAGIDVDRIAMLFEEAKLHRAFAVDPKSGRNRWTSAWPTRETAEEKAREQCQLSFGQPCKLLAVDDSVLAAGPDADAGKDAALLHYAGPFRSDRIPVVRASTLQSADVVSYPTAPDHKAIAIHPKGTLTVTKGAGSPHAAEELALKACNDDRSLSDTGGPCFLYATGNQVVLPLRKVRPVSPETP